jgi:dimethylamine---corrinoid protein Co-methyltransferase
MSNEILTRMGDGERIKMSSSEIREELRSGSESAAGAGRIPVLTDDEIEALYDIIAEPGKIVSVPHGDELIVTDDGIAECFGGSEADGGTGVPINRFSSVLSYERGLAADTASLGHEDYSFKPVKAILDAELMSYYNLSMLTTVPLFYGSQPNMGLYYQPDGPFPNPADLLPQGKIKEAREAQEGAAEQLYADMVYVGKELNEMGCEGINFDTAGSTGDAELYATLKAARELKELAPDMSIIIGMASEFVLGMHGEITFDGKRLAGLFPHEQVKLAESVGADIFGPAINVNTTRTFPWNLANAITFVKETVLRAEIPVHPNVGMGVCGIPMLLEVPVDCVSRTAKAMALIGKADGL